MQPRSALPQCGVQERRRGPSPGNRAQEASAAGRSLHGEPGSCLLGKESTPGSGLPQGGPGPSGLCQMFSQWEWGAMPSMRACDGAWEAEFASRISIGTMLAVKRTVIHIYWLVSSFKNHVSDEKGI